jgi:hypothetical protein
MKSHFKALKHLLLLCATFVSGFVFFSILSYLVFNRFSYENIDAANLVRLSIVLLMAFLFGFYFHYYKKKNKLITISRGEEVLLIVLYALLCVVLTRYILLPIA